jgi:hypothetical protein
MRKNQVPKQQPNLKRADMTEGTREQDLIFTKVQRIEKSFHTSLWQQSSLLLPQVPHDRMKNILPSRI